MAELTAGKIAEVMFEEVMETIEDQQMLLNIVDRFEPDPGNMMNADNFLWRPVEQQAYIQEGWDMEGKETGIIEETYPSILGQPKNDFVAMRADKMRDLEFWRRRGKRSAAQMGVNQNQAIVDAIKLQGSLFYKQALSDSVSGFDFIATAQRIMNEQQRTHTQRHFILNDADNQRFAQDLAARQTLQGRPAETWQKGQIGSNVAEFDVHVASFLPGNKAQTLGSSTIVGDYHFKPEAGSVNPLTGAVTNVDYRTATITLANMINFEPGDKVVFEGGTSPVPTVNSIGASTKTDSGELRTFAIVATDNDASTITIYPKPIGINDIKDDGNPDGLTPEQLAYANCSSLLSDGATIKSLSDVMTPTRSNIFFDQDAIEVISGTIPAQLFAEYDGHKVISATMKNGHPMYMVYDANMVNMEFRYRLFSWWGVTVKDPMRCGSCIVF